MEFQATHGSYRILHPLGEGSLCDVHLAREDAATDRLVALKVLKKDVASPRTRELFRSELRALERLDHPHVAKVLGAGTTPAGLPYCAMEFVPGQSLTSFCIAAHLGLHARIELFLQVCEAVEHANRRGVLHRDIKPDNVLVTWLDGRPFVKLIDFNLARVAGAEEDAEDVDSVVGTPAYMSPEQADPAAGADDSRSDVYSLGVLLYQLMADSLPFDQDDLLGEGFAGLRRTLHERIPTAPSDRVRDEFVAKDRPALVTRLRRQFHGLRLRGDLDAIVLRALEKRPDARYASAHALHQDLQRYLDGSQLLTVGNGGLGNRILRHVTRPELAMRVAAVALVSFCAQLFGTAGDPARPAPGHDSHEVAMRFVEVDSPECGEELLGKQLFVRMHRAG